MGEPIAITAGARTCIVVPAYNEEHRFQGERLEAFLAESAGVDFILVNDGSTDRTLELLRALEVRWPGRIDVLDLDRNRGKAEAVRQGMLRAFARPGVAYAGFWDADLATPLEAIEDFQRTLDRNPSMRMVIGSRVALLGRRIDRKPLRHYCGRFAATAASLVLGSIVYDTQCGAKLFRTDRDMAALFGQPFGSRWIFDVELLARYLRRFGGDAGIYELPLDRWQDVGSSKVRPRDYIRAFGELANVYRQYRLPERYRAAFDVVTSPFSRYVGAGAIGTLSHLVALAVAVELAGLSPTLGTGLGAVFGAGVNYALNYHFTFVSTAAHVRTLPRYLGVAVFGMAVSMGVVRHLTMRFGTAHYLEAQLVATGLVLVLGFLLNRAWTFGSAASSGDAAMDP